MNRILLYLISFFACTTLSAQSQKGIVKGRVLAADSLPAGFVPVGVKGTKTGTTTDYNGYYELKVHAGQHTLVVQFVGHAVEEKQVGVIAGQTTQVEDFKLVETNKELQEVVVVGKTEAQEIRETPFSVTSIDLTAMKNINVDVASVLNRVPGLRIRESGGLGSNMNITLNGMSSLRIFIDGLPADGFGSSFSFNNFPVNIIERIDVYRGVTPVFLGGDVLGGAINIITKKENVKFMDASYSYGSFNTHQVALAGRFISKKNIAVNVNGFFNHSDNDYPIEVMGVVDESNLLTKLNVRRPNNAYTSRGITLEAGVVNKKWADRLLIGGVVSANRKGLQGITITSTPEMDAFQRETSFSPTLKYEKRNLFTKGLDLRVSGLYTNAQEQIIDTGRTAYYWDGRVNPRITNKSTGSRSFQENGKYTTNTITNLMYQLGNNHSFVLSHNWNRFTRNTHDRFAAEDPNYTGSPPSGKITKHITGISYQLSLFRKRWVTTAFGKGYYMVSSIGSEAYGAKSSEIFIPGRGIASTFRIGWFQFKASYEYAVTLPNAEQIFGLGGQFWRPNLDLKPEESHNTNAGVMLNKQWKLHSISSEAGLFYRKPHNYIQLDPSRGNISQYVNVEAVVINGIEGNIRYSYSDLFYIDASGTYQEKLWDQEYYPNGKKDPRYGDRIPNEPYMYGNLNAGFFTKVYGKNKWRAGINWNTAYTERFPKGYESLSYNPIYIKQQFSHDLSLTYSLRSGKYNLSLSCRNLTNQVLMDNFAVPKPGRSFNVKIRVNLSK